MPKRRLPLVTGSYRDSNRHWSRQECIGWLPVRAEQPGTLTEWQLRQLPGCKPFVHVGTSVAGEGEPVFRDDPRFAELITRFAGADLPSVRAIIVVTATRVSDSCGYGVPLFDYREQRTLHTDFFGRKTDSEFGEYCERKDYVGVSLDGLPGLPLPLPPRPV